MSFETYDKDKLFASILDTLRSRVADYDRLIELDDIEFLRDVKCIYVYHPELFDERENKWRKMPDAADEVTDRTFREFESLMRIIELKQRYKINFEEATKFFTEYCAFSHGFPRLVDHIFFIIPHTAIDPLVFKLATGLHIYEVKEISLYDLVRVAKESCE